MQPNIGYDREAAHRHALSLIQELSPFGRPPQATRHILPVEVEYVAAKLAATFFFLNSGELDPGAWYSGDPEDLVREIERHPASVILLEQAEKAATALLVREGVVTRCIEFPELARRLEFFDPQGAAKRKRRCHYRRIAKILYGDAARMAHLKERQRFVLGRMSLHFELWASILALVPGYEVFRMFMGAQFPVA